MYLLANLTYSNPNVTLIRIKTETQKNKLNPKMQKIYARPLKSS